MDAIKTLRDVRLCLAQNVVLQKQFDAALNAGGPIDSSLTSAITVELARAAIIPDYSSETGGRQSAAVLREWIALLKNQDQK